MCAGDLTPQIPGWVRNPPHGSVLIVYTYRGTSLIRNTFLPMLAIGPQAEIYRRVLRGGVSCERGTCAKQFFLEFPDVYPKPHPQTVKSQIPSFSVAGCRSFMVWIDEVFRMCTNVYGNHRPPPPPHTAVGHRGTLPRRNSAHLGSYRRTRPRALWWSSGGVLFLISEVHLSKFSEYVPETPHPTCGHCTATQHVNLSIASLGFPV